MKPQDPNLMKHVADLKEALKIELSTVLFDHQETKGVTDHDVALVLSELLQASIKFSAFAYDDAVADLMSLRDETETQYRKYEA